MSVRPLHPHARVCAGLDWAQDDHAVCVIDDHGEILERFVVAHNAAGLRDLLARLEVLGVTQIGIERGDGPVVEALLATEITVLVISPNQVKNLRSRYGAAGNKDDRFDAYVLADVVRTDRHRLTPLVCSSPATRALRSTVRARRDLVAHRVALANQLRAHLQIVFPGAVGLFSDLDSPISLAFLTRFPTQSAAQWLTPDRFANWLSRQHYTGRADPGDLHHKLTHAPRPTPAPTDPDTTTAHAAVTAAIVTALSCLRAQITTLDHTIAEQLDRHPDAHILTSLPRSGTVRAARLLAEIGDARGRFPTAASLACLAGVAPSTRQSGKHKTVTFRWAADKQLRDALCDFAGDSRRANPWAEDLYQRARARGHDHPHAVRILARAWANIIWRCWQDHTSYDPRRHHALQRTLNPAA